MKIHSPNNSVFSRALLNLSLFFSAAVVASMAVGDQANGMQNFFSSSEVSEAAQEKQAEETTSDDEEVPAAIRAPEKP